MTKIVNVCDVLKGNLESGLYKCFDVEDEYTLNIGYGEIEIIHIDKGLLNSGKPCQFAFLDNKLFFRVVRRDLIAFINVNEEAVTHINGNHEIIIDELPVFIKEQILDDIIGIQANENGLSLLKRETCKRKTISPFIKDTTYANSVQKSPFRSNRLTGTNKLDLNQMTHNLPHSKSKIKKVESNNKNTIQSIKEKNDGLLRWWNKCCNQVCSDKL